MALTLGQVSLVTLGSYVALCLMNINEMGVMDTALQLAVARANQFNVHGKERVSGIASLVISLLIQTLRKEDM